MTMAPARTLEYSLPKADTEQYSPLRELLVKFGFREVKLQNLAPEQIRGLLEYTQESMNLPMEEEAILWFYLGYVLGKRNDHEAAVSAFSKAISLGIKKAVAYYNRANHYAEMGDSKAAAADYTRALQLDPSDKLAYYNRGYTYAKMGNLDAAISDCNEAIKLDPRDPLAYSNRGIAYALKGEWGAAVDDYEKAYYLRQQLPDGGLSLLQSAAQVAAQLGIFGIKKSWLPDVEAGIKAFIRWRDRARRNKQLAAFKEVVESFKKTLPEEDKEALEEFELGVRLLSIRDPFKGWDALTKEISKVWPKNVSAVQAIREQRD